MERYALAAQGPSDAADAGVADAFAEFRKQYVIWGTTVAATAGLYKNIAQALKVQAPKTGIMSYLRSDRLMIALNVIRNVSSVPLTFDTTSPMTEASGALKIFAYSDRSSTRLRADSCMRVAAGSIRCRSILRSRHRQRSAARYRR